MNERRLALSERMKFYPFIAPIRDHHWRTLEALANGECGGRIRGAAQFVGRTEATVKNHLLAVREGLGVATNEEAIMIAVYYGMITWRMRQLAEDDGDV